MRKYLPYLPLFIFLLAAGAWVFNYDKSLARTTDVAKNSAEIELMQQEYRQRFKQIKQDGTAAEKRNRAMFLDKRIWTIKQRYQYGTMDQTTQETLRDLQLELQQLRREGF